MAGAANLAENRPVLIYMDIQDKQDLFVGIERLLTVSTVLGRYKNPAHPVYPCLNPSP